ncbi:MAG: universal stress protein [Caulobacteraceae bacterium]
MHDPYMHCSPAELAITSGRPVLVAPPAAPPLSAKQVLLAWKDTREARRALSDALPFFEQADRVVVAAVCPEVDAEQALHQTDDVVRALRRRGITAEAKVAQEKHPEGFHILRQASLEGADLIVCGAYGHSRMGEWVFGGVTADLLAQGPGLRSATSGREGGDGRHSGVLNSGGQRRHRVLQGARP